MTISYDANGKVLNISSDVSGHLKAEYKTEAERVKRTEYPQMLFLIFPKKQKNI